MRIVDIGTVIGQAHVIPTGESQWIVNYRIDLWTFNEIYWIILYDRILYNRHMAELKPDT